MERHHSDTNNIASIVVLIKDVLLRTAAINAVLYPTKPKTRGSRKMPTTLTDAITALTAAVAAETTAVNALIAAHAAGSVTPAQIQSINDATTQSTANTAAINAALTT